MKKRFSAKRVRVADLPEFDAARYLGNEITIAAYLTGILEVNDASLLASALGEVARARIMAGVDFVQSSRR